MTYPLYQSSRQFAEKWVEHSQLDAPNVGLYFTRFYEGFSTTWEVEDSSKKNFIERTAKWASQNNHEGYIQRLAQRQKDLCQSLGGSSLVLETTGPMVTGSGISHPVENGFTFHPTLGLPYLPASGVKGLLRAWVEVWMFDDVQKAADLVRDWFGHSGDGLDDLAEAGSLIFFDALPVGPVSMACDIMTPHMGKWYQKGDAMTACDYAKVAPGDWHSPKPIHFLVISKEVKFQWSIAPRLSGDATTDEERRRAAKSALQALKEALEWVGAGAKTAVGYGRMVDKVAEEQERIAKNLKESGISSAQEEWSGSKASWNKGSVELLIVNEKKKTIRLKQQAARDMRALLKPEDQTKLDKGREVSVTAWVEIVGNNTKLVKISSL